MPMSTGKFYPYNISQSREKSKKRMEKARQQNTIPILAEQQILHLIEVEKEGLPDCYKTFDDFLDDFFPDFSWNLEDSSKEKKAVCDDERFKNITPSLNKTWDIDITKILS